MTQARLVDRASVWFWRSDGNPGGKAEGASGKRVLAYLFDEPATGGIVCLPGLGNPAGGYWFLRVRAFVSFSLMALAARGRVE